MRLNLLYAVLLFSALSLLATGSGLFVPAPAGAADPSGPSAKPSPVPLHFKHNAIFALAIGYDGPTNGRIANSLAQELNRRMPSPAPDAKMDDQPPWIVPVGDWTLVDYQKQCETDKHTKGAIVVLAPSVANAVENYIALLRENTYLRFSVMMVECTNPTDNDAPDSAQRDVAGAAATPPPYQVVWVSPPVQGENGRTQVEFFPLAVLTSMYLAFAPQKVYQTVATVAFPAPNPLPAYGAHTSTQTTNATTLNPSGSSSNQNSILQAFDQSSTGTTIGAQGSPDLQTARAAEDAVGKSLDAFEKFCAATPDAKTVEAPFFCNMNLHNPHPNPRVP